MGITIKSPLIQYGCRILIHLDHHQSRLWQIPHTGASLAPEVLLIPILLTQLRGRTSWRIRCGKKSQMITTSRCRRQREARRHSSPATNRSQQPVPISMPGTWFPLPRFAAGGTTRCTLRKQWKSTRRRTKPPSPHVCGAVEGDFQGYSQIPCFESCHGRLWAGWRGGTLDVGTPHRAAPGESHPERQAEGHRPTDSRDQKGQAG
ncbi:hypothetical protein DFS34DRAFT_605173 [Phlyctochytrium arcticum]|nr:hypothetical protein DFS34DRAFT_605173 [Phlyctochytrium arcticum]